ncbi:uncharacterized protein FOMMEDRAFT_27031 [Fomitiporia mediterranea MF3/22]|uniref:uncharacterized protein n=1 Tax=Fomitiporia mediterranea (strain MF3/22) TaxID=694068 RepID=UPI0004408BD7|nr:uncharacterized protein FOMMEDRAFT_27031 [Fomitiporia mediterranea MF3/22]EJD04688.1 hypothetical protein FOMMEDRAFT_27031 [Fomitiporia mediterranea MF3/22]
MATLQTATINDAGTQFAYLDSGAPPGDTYITLVIIHGHTYHAQNFSRLLPIAKDHNLRIIALNRRDYVGSTPFSSAELEALNNSDVEAQVAFLKARGLEIARFLVWVITEKKIPTASADGKEGGLAVLGWSMGNLTTMAFMRHLNAYPRDLVESIRPYLRALYIYENGATTMGYPSAEGGYHPLYDKSESIPARMRGIVFGTWVSSYYRHPYFSSVDKNDRNISLLILRAPEGDQLYRPCTLDTLSAIELTTCVDPAAAAHSEPIIISNITRPVLYDQTQDILLLDYQSPNTKKNENSGIQEGSASALLPDVKICIVYCDASVWSCVRTIWELEKDYERWEKEGRKIREHKFLHVREANHFLHWEDPEMFLKVVEDGLRS